MANWSAEQESPTVEDVSVPSPAAPAAAAGQVTANAMFWLFGLIFLALGGFGVCIHIQRLNAPEQPGPWPGVILGGVGFICLVLAACGVGSKHCWRVASKRDANSTDDPPAGLVDRKAGARRSGPFSDRPLPFFHVRFKPPSSGLGYRIYRVFLADDDFLFLSLHVATVNRQHPSSVTTGLASGGVVGGLVGGLVAGVSAYCQMKAQDAYRARTRLLDGGTDEGRLRQLAEADPESFILTLHGIRDLRVEPPSFWDKLSWPGEIAAKIRLLHPTHGRMSLGLPCFEDVCKAMEVLPQRFGNEVQITGAWNAF